MLIKEKGQNTLVEVYGLYWVDNVRYHYVIPYDGHEGFISLRSDELEIIEFDINNFVLFVSEHGGEVLIHKLAADDNLVYDLIDHNADAMTEFKRRLTEYK